MKTKRALAIVLCLGLLLALAGSGQGDQARVVLVDHDNRITEVRTSGPGDDAGTFVQETP